MANKEVYRLDIKVGVSGDSEAKSKLTATEKMAEQARKKLQALNRITASATVKLNDQASSKLDKLESKASKFKSANMTLTAKLRDEASSNAEKIQKKTDKLKDSNPTVRIKAEDQASKTINKIENTVNGWIKVGAKKIISIGLAGVLATGGIGLGTSIKTFSQYEQGLSNVKAVTDATDSQMEELGNTAKTLGASTAWSAVQVTQAEELLGQAGFSVQETITALPGLLSLASAGSLDLAAATDIASGTLRAFGLSASSSAHVADVLALSASATNSDVTDLGETMKYVAPVSASLGISLEDTAAAAGLLSNQNIKGSQAGTILRQTMARLASPTKEAAEMMSLYGINAFDAHGNMKPLSSVVDNLNSSLGKLTSQQRADVISNVFGTESMSGVLALMNQGGESLSDLSQRLKDANGAADKMAETKLDNLAGQWEQLKGAVETAQIELGERLAPYAKQFVTWLSDKMPAITDKIVEMVEYVSKHTDEIKSLATTVIGLGAAFITLSTAGKIGNTITGISSLVNVLKGAKLAEETVAIAGGLSNIGLIGKLLPAIFTPAGLAVAASIALIGTAVVANNNLMKKTLSTTTEELGPVEQIMNLLHGNIYKSKEEMQQLGLVYEDFGDNISDDFKKKVQQSTKSIREFQLYINKINLDNVISDSESSEFDNKVNEMCYSAIKTIEDNKAKSQEGLKNMFMDDGTFSEAEKATLEYLSRDYDTKITAEQTLRDKIYEIRKKAVEEHRALNNEDLQNIKDYQAQMAQIELESAGGNTDELLYAKNKFKARTENGTLSLTDGSELAQEAAKDRDDRITEVKAKYDTNLDKLKASLAEAQSDPNASSDDIDKIKRSIEESSKARAAKIEEINRLWDENLDALYNSNSNLRGKINKYDGTQLSGADIEDQNALENIKKQYADLNNVTEDGFYGFKDAQGIMNELYVTVDQRTGEITGAWNTTTEEIGAYTDTLKEKIKSLGNVHNNDFGGAMKYLTDMGATLDSASNSVISSAGETISTLDNVQTASDGTVTGIIKINNTPIEITCDNSGAIIGMNEVDKKLKSLDGRVAEARINLTTTFSQSAINYGEQDGARFTRKIPENYNGTNNGSRGINSVAERGFEIVMGRQFRWFNGGEKVLNHEQSKAFLESQQNNEPFQVKQGQYELIQPQVEVAGAGGISFGDINVSVDGSQNTDGIVNEVTNEVGRRLKEALSNIKK